jgi:exodeoxyribonuclease V alpha subunit
MKQSYDYGDEDSQTLIANGDVGKVECISDGYCVINFDGVRVVYTKFDLSTCRHAYSLSIHRSQGGNAKYVILVSPKEHQRMLNSNLIYVGLTRAKEKVFHIGDVATVNKSIIIKAEYDRLTYLKEMLMEEVI